MRRSIRLLAPVLLLAVAGVLPTAPAGAEGEEGEYRTTKGKTEPIYTESVLEEYRIPTKHGTIYGVVERPVVPEGVKVPVILTYSPYNVLRRPIGTAPQVEALADATGAFFIPRGYARAEFDLVGTRESAGCYDHGGIREQETGYDVVEFLAAQPWSSGKIGMIGGSYDGTTQWAAAIKTPPHLTTIVPQVAIGRWYDYAYGQGVRFASGSGTPVLFDFGFGFLPPTNVQGGAAWAEAVVAHANPCERVEHNDRAFLPDPVYDAFWDERDYLQQIAKVKASVLLVGSWQDYNVHPINSYEMWRALPAALPKKLIMGQAGHSGKQVEDTEDLYHAWFDKWLMGIETSIMALPQSDSEVNGKERFQDAAWPPPATRDVPLTLALGTAEKGSLGLADLETAQWTDNDPQLSEGDVLGGRADGSALVFVGPAVGKRVRISGVPVLDASVTTDAESTHITPILFDEAPDGGRVRITRGLLNSRNRDSLRESTPLAPGSAWRARIDFQPVDWVLEEGHRLGLAVMSMNTNEALYGDTTRATNELALDGGSRLLVPTSFGGEQLGRVANRPAPRPVPAPPVAAGPAAAPRPASLPATGGGVATWLAAPAAIGFFVALRRRRHVAAG
ncbi:MAG TPA: CocE/NonD family hydrolase [Mycobacteriales bacterium]|nr:CocE/NonD family hydrolase [Mycobacteriales bacterium]